MKWLRISGTGYALAAFLLFYAVFWSCPLFFYFNNSIPVSNWISQEAFGVAFWLLFISCAFLYGVLRVGWAHPIFRPRYCDWLLSMPWKPGMPLPEAPILPTWQDAAVLAAAIVLGTIHAGRYAVWIPFSMLCGAFLAFLPIALFLRWRPILWAQAILLCLAARFYLDSTVALLSAAGLLAVLLWGLRHSMQTFPWGLTQAGQLRAVLTAFFGLSENAPLFEPQLLDAAYPNGDWRAFRGIGHVVGWPLWVLSPHKLRRFLHWAEVVALSLLVGWLVYMVTKEDRSETSYAISAIAGILALLRVGIYCSCLLPPISLLGRLATGRLLIPRYDRVFVAPVLSVLCAALLPTCLQSIGIRVDISQAAAAALSAIIVFAMGPRLGEHLTTSPGQLARNNPWTTRIGDR